MFEAVLHHDAGFSDDYNIEIRGDLGTFVKIHGLLREKSDSTGGNDTYSALLSRFAHAISSGQPSLTAPLSEIVRTIGINDWESPTYYATMFGINLKEIGRRRREITLKDFMRTQHIGIENAKAFSKFITFNMLFWLGEKTVSDVEEPIVLGNMDEKTVIVNKDGVFKLILKKIPTSSVTVSSAVNNYVSTLEQQSRQYKSFLDQMIKDVKKQMLLESERVAVKFIDKMAEMHRLGYSFKTDNNSTLWFYKKVLIEPESLLHENTVYPWQPLHLKMFRFIQEYKDWVRNGTPNLSAADLLKNRLFEDVFVNYGKNFTVLERLASPYVQDLYIDPALIIGEKTTLRVKAGSGYHTNMDALADRSIGFRVCLGNLEKVTPALNAVSMIEDTLKMMNHDSPLNPKIGQLAFDVNDAYPDTGTQSPDSVKAVNFKDTVTFHTI